jgi:hypothetical protein
MAYDTSDPNIGPHTTYFEPPDIIFLRIVGSVEREDGFEINRRHPEFAKGKDAVFFLIDLSGLEKIDPAVRKRATEVLNEVPLKGMVGFGASLKAKVVAKLIFTALNLFSGKGEKIPLEFTETEAQARAWIEKRRQELKAGKAAGGKNAR